MCAGPFKPKMPTGPTQEQKEAREASRTAQRKALQEERRTMSQQKQEEFQRELTAVGGRRGRRSLLTGSRGGSGFTLADSYKTKQTLGA
mgnify:CR=1 FL=1|tara:strand:+ start:302 stop:568 length:267 start_codon:yes stop_codon:yes gene_type:complete